MSKHFDGHKVSHCATDVGERQTCPICGKVMVMFNGKLRCTELRRSHGSESGNTFRVVLHGSLDTIKKRLAKNAQWGAR
jgi:hypothetical protein